MNIADVVLILLLLGAAVSGYRRGLVTAVLSLVGAIAGALIAIRLAPIVVDLVSDSTARIALAIAVMMIGIGVGELAGQWLGVTLTRRITWQPALTVDRGLGTVGQLVAALLVAWLVALPLAVLPVPWLASQVRSSAVLGAVDTAMPRAADDVSARLRRALADSGFPQILAPLAPTPDTPVAAPDPAVSASPAVVAAGRSVLKVRARAPQCGVAMEGSGFVVRGGPDGGALVVTNAHVVAGAGSVSVVSASGPRPAAVVGFDSDVDLAVLRVGHVSASPLSFAPDGGASSGDDAVAAGYPLDGPFTLSPMRVRSELMLTGPDITGDRTVTREVYTVRGLVRPGNSGGPLLAPDGTVLGVVFAAAVDKPDVGFVLTRGEVAPIIESARRHAAAGGSAAVVGTGGCLSH